MFARVVKFEGFDTSDESPFDRVRDRAVEILEGIPGWQGGMQLVDRANGAVLNIHLFDSRESMEAAEATFEDMPRRLGQDVQEIAARRSSVERYEVVAERRKGG